MEAFFCDGVRVRYFSTAYRRVASAKYLSLIRAHGRTHVLFGFVKLASGFEEAVAFFGNLPRERAKREIRGARGRAGNRFALRRDAR